MTDFVVPSLPERIYNAFNLKSIGPLVPKNEADLFALMAAIVVYFVADSAQRKINNYENFIGFGGRESILHNTGVFVSRHVTNMLIATAAMIGVYQLYGVNTNLLGINTPIKVTPSLQSRDDNPVSAQPGICSHQTNPYKALPGCQPTRP